MNKNLPNPIDEEEEEYTEVSSARPVSPQAAPEPPVVIGVEVKKRKNVLFIFAEQLFYGLFVCSSIGSFIIFYDQIHPFFPTWIQGIIAVAALLLTTFALEVVSIQKKFKYSPTILLGRQVACWRSEWEDIGYACARVSSFLDWIIHWLDFGSIKQAACNFFRFAMDTISAPAYMQHAFKEYAHKCHDWRIVYVGAFIIAAAIGWGAHWLAQELPFGHMINLLDVYSIMIIVYGIYLASSVVIIRIRSRMYKDCKITQSPFTWFGILYFALWVLSVLWILFSFLNNFSKIILPKK
jgi:hypothetical protein